MAVVCTGCLQAERDNPLENNPARVLSVESLTLVRPNGAEYWFVGAPHEIVWVQDDVDATVSLRLSIDNGRTYPHEIAEAIPNTGSFTWEVPDLPSEQCRVRIIGSDPEDVRQDDSDVPFTILRKPAPRQRTVQGGEWPSWRNDRLAFMSDRSGDYDVWVLNISGGQQIRITTDPGFDGHPAFDKKGLHLAFTSDRTGRNEIWATAFFLNNDPTLIQLTTGGGEQPNWRPFPSASRFTYLAPRPGGMFNIVKAEISLPLSPASTLLDFRLLTHVGLHQKPVWSIRSGDSAEIVYFQTIGGGSDPRNIFSVRVDVPFDRPRSFRLPFPSPVKNPAVSPGGSKLAVSMNGDLWMVAIADGKVAGQPLQLTFDPAEDDVPNWRSESELAFQSNRSGQWEIWTLKVP